jgi:DNA-binding transcriptional LysR family regulator
MLNVRIKQLIHAIVLSEELNYVRAAERVFLTQSALSRSIQGLEETLGVRLFERSVHAVSLTPVGTAFVKRARLLVGDAERLQQDMRRQAAGEGGAVSFGVGPMMAGVLIPAMLEGVRVRYPGLRIQVVTHQPDVLLAQLNQRQIEFFIADIRALQSGRDLEILPLPLQAGGFLCRSAHPLLQRGPVALPDVLRYGLYAACMSDALHQLVKPALQLSAHEDLPILAESNDLRMLKAMTLNSDVILLATLSCAEEELQAAHLVPLVLSDTLNLHAEPGIVSLKQYRVSPPGRMIIDSILAQQIRDAAPGSL